MGIDELMLFYYLFYGTVKKKITMRGRELAFGRGSAPILPFIGRGAPRFQQCSMGGGQILANIHYQKQTKNRSNKAVEYRWRYF